MARSNEPPRRIDQPEPGTFAIRFVRKGPLVAARITHAMGFWSASIEGIAQGPRHPDPFAADGVSRIWESAARITQAEYDALLHSKPATPNLPINLGALPPITFEDPAMNAMNPAARIGHNAAPPTIDLHAALEPDALKAWIGDKLAPHAERAAALTARFKQFLLATAAGIANDNVDERTVDFANQIRTEIAATDATRVTIKAPVLAAQRAIDGAAKVISDTLLPALTEVTARHTAYLVAKDKEARRVAAEAAALAEQAAYNLSQQAANTNDAETFDQADAALVEQQAAEAIVYAPAPELTRVRTANGSTSSLRDNWTYTVADISAVPAPFLMINDAAVRAAIKGGSRHIPGLTIRNVPKASIR